MNLFMNDQVKDRLDKFYDLPVEIQNKILNDLDPTKIIMAISDPDNLTQMVRGLPVINLTRSLFGLSYVEEFEIVPRARASRKDVLPYKQVYIDYYYCLALLWVHNNRLQPSHN